METFSNKFEGKKGINEYYCEICHFKCCKKYSWERHLITTKHLNATNSNNLKGKTGKVYENKSFSCEKCEKEYKDRTGLWRHKKNCSFINNNVTDKNDKLIEYLIKENKEMKDYIMNESKEMKELVLEIVKNGTGTINNNHTNSHNKAFNLNFFLNETCKNAINITDFVDSIKLQLSDFMEVGESGFVEGISNIIVKN